MHRHGSFGLFTKIIGSSALIGLWTASLGHGLNETFQKVMAWDMLPDLIFSDIMMMVGLESLESLHRCRQVCKTWNEKILRDIWESQSKRKIIKERIEKNWDLGMYPSDDYMYPSDEEVSHAKWLGDGCC